MSSSKNPANGLVLVQGSASGGRRSASFEKHRRQSSSGDVSMVKLAHSRSHSRSASSASGTGNGHGVTSSVQGPVVPPPPKERLLPSPPLTPVASLKSLRKAAGKERGLGSDKDAMPKSGKYNSNANTDLKGVASDRSELVEGADGERDTTEDGMDTEHDGALSSWSYRPDGVTETGTIGNTDTETTTDSGGGDDNGAGLATSSISAAATASVQPSSVLATAPQLSPSHNIAQEPIPLQEDRDTLGVNGTGTGDDLHGELHSSNESPSGTSSSLSMPYGHEANSTSPAPSHPLFNGPSLQPWDLVDPPPNNNEERLRRVRKDSNRSMPGSMVNVVVKDGKKYRIPHSSYYFGPPPDTSAFGTDPIGHIGVHHPREIVRIERDYSGGDLPQFSPAYPLELEGRITPTQFLETINAINETLLDAHSLRWSFVDNTLAVLTLYISRLFIESNYDRKMRRLRESVEKLNKEVYNPVGLNILWPKDVAFMFLEIEYY
ncbi:hypothetical protein ACEPAF_3158 [Sanghuangporus sanghuang]